MKNLFQKTIARENESRPPVWFMRQAGRYHSHYQKLKKQYSFTEICKKPDVACEATLGPIRDFDFDAAILFSDLLFPLEAMGMGLDYQPGPQLEWHLKTVEDLKRLTGGAELAHHLQFQGDATHLIRALLPASKGLLGFVGGPLTLFYYAVEGSHQGELASARTGLQDGRYEGFLERLLDLLAENMAIQARSGIDTIAVLDTCAGELTPSEFETYVKPSLELLFKKFHKLCPNFPITYYSKKTNPEHWAHLEGLPISCIGIDWNHDLSQVLVEYSDRWAIQGNIDPEWMLYPASQLAEKVQAEFEKVKALEPKHLRGWICGLGHGILKTTPEENVHLFLRLQKEIFGA